MNYIKSFRLESTLGSGSNAQVKLAVHKDTGSKVAIKIIDKAHLEAKDSRNSLEKEIGIMKLLDHPNIVHLYDVYETREHLFLVLEYVTGDLYELVSKRGRLSERDAEKIFKQLVIAVDFCHKQKICHRDLKPENILIDEHMTVKLADFGMSEVMLDQYLSLSCGSPHYVCPEIILGQPYDGVKVDIWSLGVILFVLLTGQVPFNAPSVRKLLNLIVTNKFTAPSLDTFSVSKNAKDLVMRMLTKNPEKRITMSEILAHPFLHTYSHDLPEFLEPEISMERFNSMKDTDTDLLKTLNHLGWDMKHIETDLLSPTGKLAQKFYRTLEKNKKQNEKYKRSLFNEDLEDTIITKTTKPNSFFDSTLSSGFSKIKDILLDKFGSSKSKENMSLATNSSYSTSSSSYSTS
jgi:serine/threonine protein kinase